MSFHFADQVVNSKNKKGLKYMINIAIGKRNEPTLQEKQIILENLRNNPNNMSYWLPKFRDKGFNIPETTIIPINLEWLEWLQSNSYKPEKIAEFTNWIIKNLEKTDFNTDRELFIKTGNFSNKFCFSDCHVTNIEVIGKNFLNVFYGSMCVGCEPSPEICVREFIHTDYQRATIYEGMKLNTEFRIFYDFDNKSIVGMFNYWDRETMLKHLYEKEDINNFNNSIDAIEKDFEFLKDILAEQVKENISNVELTGIWSVDFMFDGKEFWLIDAAIGSQSYYFDKVKDYGGKNGNK